MSTIHLDDPRLTAYALGEELSETERAEIEKLLASDPAARAFVDEIRGLGETLSGELAKESAPGLTEGQKAAIGAAVPAASGAAAPPAAKAPLKLPLGWLGLAAAVLGAVLIGSVLVGRSAAPEAAVAQSSPSSGPSAHNMEKVKDTLASVTDESGARERIKQHKQRVREMGNVNDVFGSSPDAKPSADPKAGHVYALPQESPAAPPPTSTAGPVNPVSSSSGGGSGGQLAEGMDFADAPRPNSNLRGNKDPNAPGNPGYDLGLGGVPHPEKMEQAQAQQLAQARSDVAKAKQAFEKEIDLLSKKLSTSDARGRTREDLKRAEARLKALETKLPAPEKPNEEILALQGKLGEAEQARRTETFKKVEELTGKKTKEAGEAVLLLTEKRKEAFAEYRAAAAQYKGKAATVEEVAAKRDRVLEIEDNLRAIQQIDTPHHTEQYDRIYENPFKTVRGEDAVSTFSIDVDTASYSNVRRFLNQGQLPPPDAVRIEELVNYFDYGYTPPTDDVPFSADVEVAECPWDPVHRLVRIGLKGQVIEKDKRPASNLVFLLDVSGSMNDPNKLPLVKDAMKLLVNQLNENDTVSMVVYAGASGLVLPATKGDNKPAILGALERLSAGGSTNGGAGIQLAYDTAKAHFVEGGTNRVILCTDGDWNVGLTDRGSLVRLIEEKAKSGVFLSVLGFGMGNYKDGQMEQLADKGNGNYAYVDNQNEARKVLVEQMAGTLVTIAKDVKIQVEFNPALAGAYRLIGYENRVLAREDFNDDTKDAGEIGAGHTVTALYEVVPAEVWSARQSNEAETKQEIERLEKEMAGLYHTRLTLEQQEAAKEKEAELKDRIAKLKEQLGTPAPDDLKYQKPAATAEAAKSGELMTLKLRYKAPAGDTSKLLEFPVKDGGKSWQGSTKDYRFAASVAAFGMLLRESRYKGLANWELVRELGIEAKGEDKHGYRAEFIELVERAKSIRK